MSKAPSARSRAPRATSPPACWLATRRRCHSWMATLRCRLSSSAPLKYLAKASQLGASCPRRKAATRGRARKQRGAGQPSGKDIVRRIAAVILVQQGVLGVVARPAYQLKLLHAADAGEEHLLEETQNLGVAPMAKDEELLPVDLVGSAPELGVDAMLRLPEAERRTAVVPPQQRLVRESMEAARQEPKHQQALYGRHVVGKVLDDLVRQLAQRHAAGAGGGGGGGGDAADSTRQRGAMNMGLELVKYRCMLRPSIPSAPAQAVERDNAAGAMRARRRWQQSAGATWEKAARIVRLSGSRPSDKVRPTQSR